MMKKFLNKPEEIIDETMRGYELANRKKLYLEEGTHRMMRRVPKKRALSSWLLATAVATSPA